MMAAKTSTLVIGYGNSLRGDDGVGVAVAQQLETFSWQGVQAEERHQLTPELVMMMTEFEQVIFVDAGTGLDTVQLQHLTPEEAQGTQLGHFCDPRSLLAMSAILYHYTPQTWLITIPTLNFEFGETFSPLAEQGIKEALKIIENLVSSERNQLG